MDFGAPNAIKISDFDVCKTLKPLGLEYKTFSFANRVLHAAKNLRFFACFAFEDYRKSKLSKTEGFRCLRNEVSQPRNYKFRRRQKSLKKTKFFVAMIFDRFSMLQK